MLPHAPPPATGLLLTHLRFVWFTTIIYNPPPPHHPMDGYPPIPLPHARPPAHPLLSPLLPASMAPPRPAAPLPPPPHPTPAARTLSLMPSRTLARVTSSSCVADRAVPAAAQPSSISLSGARTRAVWYSSTPLFVCGKGGRVGRVGVGWVGWMGGWSEGVAWDAWGA